MNILITITKGVVGGAQVAVFTMAKELKNKGHTVVVATGEGDFLKNKLESENIPVHLFASLKRSANPFQNLRFILEMKRYLDSHHFDVVHFNSTNALLGAVGAKLSHSHPKTVFTFHGLSTLDPNHGTLMSRSIYWMLFKFLLLFIDENIFVSYINLKQAKKIGLLSKGHVVYNSLDQNSLGLIEKSNALSTLEDKSGYQLKNRFIIGSIGRLSREKNHEFLIKIFPSVLEVEPNAICVIIGDGIERSFLQNLISESNLTDKIYLFGEIEDAAKYLKIFDVFILPSFYEGLSISLIETIVSNVPAIASDVGGNVEIVGHDFVYPLNNRNNFLEVFKKIHSGKISQEFAKQQLLFTPSIMTEKLEEIYK